MDDEDPARTAELQGLGQKCIAERGAGLGEGEWRAAGLDESAAGWQDR